MSEHVGVHMHAPHEHMVEHEAHSDKLAQRVALTTAILATLGALFGFQSGELQTEAMMLKNDSITLTGRATDQWGYYQAKSSRETLSKKLAMIATDKETKDAFQAEAQRYCEDKAKIWAKAKALEADAATLSKESERQVPPHQNIALGVTLMQVAVALASITVLTRKRWLYIGALVSAGIGIVFAGYGYFVRPYPTQSLAEHVLAHARHAEGHGNEGHATVSAQSVDSTDEAAPVCKSSGGGRDKAPKAKAPEPKPPAPAAGGH